MEKSLERLSQKITKYEPSFNLTEVSLNMHRTASNDATTLISEVLFVTDKIMLL